MGNMWHHVVLAYDTTQAVMTNRVKLFVDGQQIMSFAMQIDPSQNSNGLVNGATMHYLGFEAGNGFPNYLNGNLADVQFIDGQAVAISALGHTDATSGQWQPIAYTGSYGTQGYHLTFASGGIGTDVSGNGHSWTPVGLSTSDVSSLSPGGSSSGQVTPTAGNMVLIGGSGNDALTGGAVI